MFYANKDPLMNSATFVFSRLLIKLYERFPISIDISRKVMRKELEKELFFDESGLPINEAVLGAISFLKEEGFIRHDANSTIKDGSSVLTNCRLTKCGLALMDGPISDGYVKLKEPRSISLVEFLKEYTTLERLDEAGKVLHDAFVRH